MERKKSSDFDRNCWSFRSIRPWRHQSSGVFGRRCEIRDRRSDGNGIVGHASAQLCAGPASSQEDDKRIKAEYTMYPSPKGNSSKGMMRGLLARPATDDKFPSVVVVTKTAASILILKTSCDAWRSPGSWRSDRTRFGLWAVIRVWTSTEPKPMKGCNAENSRRREIVEDFVAAAKF